MSHVPRTILRGSGSATPESIPEDQDQATDEYYSTTTSRRGEGSVITQEPHEDTPLLGELGPEAKGDPTPRGERNSYGGACISVTTPRAIPVEKVDTYLRMWEPLTDTYRTQNPAPLQLCARHFGMALVQIASIFAGYTFLVSNAKVVFPRCSSHRVIDAALGLNTGTGWLCEITSLGLWTFPLVCCMLIPMFQYWDFCDTRLYYECLREKLLLKISKKSFFTSPVAYFIILYLLVGMSSVFFSTPDAPNQRRDKLLAFAPFLLPVFSFLVTVYFAWDLRLFLITLPKFTEFDLEWCKGHLQDCSEAFDVEMCLTCQRLFRSGQLGPGASSSEIFQTLRQAVVKPEIRSQRRSLVSGDGTDMGSTKELLSNAWQKGCALILGMKGYWMTDLLWLPTDERAREFKMAFRCLAVATVAIEVAMVFLLTCTVVQFAQMQGHLDRAEYWWMPNLKIFII